MKSSVLNGLLVVVSLIVSFCLMESALVMLRFEPPAWKYPSSQLEKEICLANSFDEIIDKGFFKSVLGFLKPDKDLGYTYDMKPHGFIDSKNVFGDYETYKRVLVLGDSFTAGDAVSAGKSYVERLNQYYQNHGVLLFNTGVGGYGQNNQFAVLKKYYPILRPQAVLLGFFTGNDFGDNLTPLDRYTAFGGKWIMNYEVGIANDKVHIRRRNPDEVLRIYQEFIGCDKMAPDKARSLKDFLREKMFYQTRLGTLMYQFMHQLKNRSDHGEIGRQTAVLKSGERDVEVEVTEEVLLAIRRYLDERGTPFYILLIPDVIESKTYLKKSKNYFKAVQLFEKHKFRYFDPFDRLTLGDYILTNNNGHWNSEGHLKAYELVRNSLANEFPHW